MPLILILGGTRSGKSRFAVELARCLSLPEAGPPLPVTLIATAEPRDEEMARRIRAHRLSRPRHWRVYEEPREVEGLIRELGSRPGVILLDCLSLLLSNWMEESNPETARPAHPAGPEARVQKMTRRRVQHLARACARAPAQVIVVSSEVGMGVVPAHLKGRLYRDLLGEANQILAARAREVYLVVAGVPLLIKAPGHPPSI